MCFHETHRTVIFERMFFLIQAMVSCRVMNSSPLRFPLTSSPREAACDKISEVTPITTYYKAAMRDIKVPHQDLYSVLYSISCAHDIFLRK